MPPDPEDLKSKVPWYHEKLEKIDPTARKLLEERGIPSDAVLDHVQTIRDKAWNIYPYPCIGMFSFTRLHLINHPLYTSTILPTLQSGGTLLDLGSGFSADFRALVSAGVDSGQFTALDNHDGFWKLGKELFRDEETMKARFVVADMKDLSSIPKDMVSSFDMIWAGASFHLFDWDGQFKASVVAARMLRARKGSAVYGYQLGRTTGREMKTGGMFVHDTKTFEKLWEDVGTDVGFRFEVKTWMYDSYVDDLKKGDEEIRRLKFVVIRGDEIVKGDGEDAL